MKKITAFALTLALVLSSLTSFAFHDVQKDHWALEYITTLSDDGIIKGYEDSSFRPEENVTKAELGTILTRAFGLSGQKSFDDITHHWAKDYIEKSGEYFYNPSKNFCPDTKATRAEVAYALSGVLSLSESKKDMPFKDFDLVDANMKDKIMSAVESGLLKGYEDGTLRPNHPVTRAETSALIVRAIELSKNSDSKPDGSDKPVEDEGETPDHIYTRHPLKDIFLVKNVTKTTDIKTGEECIKLTYALSEDAEKEYTSLIPVENDIVFSGLRPSITDLATGDLFIFDTGFIGRISTIATVATLSSDTVHTSIPDVFAYGSGAKYEFIAGTVTQYDKKTKTMVLTLENLLGTYEISVPLKANAVAYRESRNNKSFKAESVSYIDVGTYVFVRYTDGVCTDIIMK